jgi:TIR domain-containing protein
VADVFISYATEDSHRATKVAEGLVSSGILVWLEPGFQARSVVAGEIKNQLSRAKCVLILWSHHSVRSMWVRDQANVGHQRGALLPVLIEPLDDRQEVPAEFLDMPYEDLSTWNGDSQAAEFVTLTERIKRMVDSSATPVRSPSKTVFVCYRRQDAEDAAGRLHDKLVSVYGSERVFMDIDNVPLGVNFVTHIKERLQDCGAVLVIVGRNWTTITDPEGSRRLDNPADHVRVEVATALKQGTIVIPILVQGASMPRSADLPEDIRDLAFYNGLRLTPEFWRPGVERLIKELDRSMKR